MMVDIRSQANGAGPSALAGTGVGGVDGAREFYDEDEEHCE